MIGRRGLLLTALAAPAICRPHVLMPVSTRLIAPRRPRIGYWFEATCEKDGRKCTSILYTPHAVAEIEKFCLQHSDWTVTGYDLSRGDQDGRLVRPMVILPPGWILGHDCTIEWPPKRFYPDFGTETAL